MKIIAVLGLATASLTAVAASAFSQPTRTITCPLGQPTAVTAAAFTPGGARLAYARGSALTVSTLRGHVVARRALDATPSQLAWAPSGRAFAYVSGNRLHLVDGTDRTLFSTIAPLELGGWLADGAAIVVSTSAIGPAGTPTPETYVVATSDGSVRDLGPGAHAVPSPDGTRVAVVAGDADGSGAQLSVIDVRSGARRTIFHAAARQFPPAALIPALAWSPDSRQVAFLWDIDVEPDLLAQNADGSSTGLFGTEHGALPSEIGMIGAIRWTARGIVGEAQFEDGGSLIAFYNTHTGNERGTGVSGYGAAFLAASQNGMYVVYNAIGLESTAKPGLRIAAWNGANDRPFVPCKGTAHADRLHTSAEPTTINAGRGNDVVFARNGQPDVLDCGPGIDTAFVERRDVVRHCEHIRRSHP